VGKRDVLQEGYPYLLGHPYPRPLQGKGVLSGQEARERMGWADRYHHTMALGLHGLPRTLYDWTFAFFFLKVRNWELGNQL
jgi:hypothetical protein